MPFIGILKQISPSCERYRFSIFLFFFFSFLYSLSHFEFFDRIAPLLRRSLRLLVSLSRYVKKKKKNPLSILIVYYRIIVDDSQTNFTLRDNIVSIFSMSHFSFRIPFLAPSPLPPPLFVPCPLICLALHTYLSSPSCLLLSLSLSLPLIRILAVSSPPRFPTSQGDYFFCDFPSFSSIQRKGRGTFDSC